MFQRKESLLTKISLLEDQTIFSEAADFRGELHRVQSSISDMCAKQNKERVTELIDDDNVYEGNIQAKIWAMRKKLAPKTSDQPPTAKKDELGNLVSSKEELENLYLRIYVSRLTPNPVTDEIKEII